MQNKKKETKSIKYYRNIKTDFINNIKIKK